ncbi:phage tail sheath subtilisin-like domain-containing protein [Terrabacter sp. MAHUQ-38]|uniref:phage tail sheath subtilisin-like domain-containing protein n=1 Tax=unclassified Terrabacter TaxID=2630222 RepID=UPI00165E3B70|nr:phage tail sheath subtilisin-like domain-containing protein [Terrabacter sp. MAHUQ-38]
MTTYLSPGVYVEEVPSGPQPIAAAPTSVVAVLGTTRKGPVKEPTRVTGWADFVRTFGAATSRGFTGESVFGYFENGGPAAWIVRVDPSTSASWTAFDVAGAESFDIEASSPGTWGNDLAVSVSGDESAASGAFYRASTTAATPAISSGGGATIAVASTGGLKPGDTVALVAAPTTGSVAAPPTATVTALTTTSITVGSASAAVTLPAGSVVASAAASGATSLFLPSGKGFRKGDVVVAVAPNGSRSSAVVTDVTQAGSGVTLTLDASPGAVPGAAFVQRRADFRALATVAGTPAGSPPSLNITASALAFDRPLTAPIASELTSSLPEHAAARLTTGDGRTALWQTNRFVVVGATAPPSGPVTVNAPVSAVLLSDGGLGITGLTAADVANAYGFLPAGARVTFTGAGATPTVVATRTPGGFTLAPAPVATDTYTDATFTLQADADEGIAVRCGVAPRVGDVLGLGTAFAPITAVDAVGGDTYVLRFAAGTAVSNTAQVRFPLYAVESASVVAARFSLTVTVGGVVAESFGGLSLSPDHPAYFAKDDVVNGISAFVSVTPRGVGAPAVSLAAAPFYTAVDRIGADKAPTNDDFRAGLSRLEEVTEPAMVICPDALGLGDPLLHADLVGQVVTHCENFRRYAIVDAPDLDDTDLLAWRNTTLSSTYAGLYAPHLQIVTVDPDSIDRFTTVPPSGFVAGVFARTDRLRGVHKAPGNETVTGIVGLSQTYTQRRQDLLNPGGVNLIRAFPGRGTRLWGARNATDDTTWRYVNVRRLFNMIETSVDRATQWVVFEPNTAQTWIRVKVSVENFLDQQWRAGALAGTKPEQAYRVRVGLGETMTEADIDLGLIITEVAIAPAKPAEFVVFRFSHKRLSE